MTFGPPPSPPPPPPKPNGNPNGNPNRNRNRNRNRTAWAVVAAAVAVLLVAGFALLRVVGEEEEKGVDAAPATRYRLTLPKKVLEGTYHLVHSSREAPSGDGTWNPADVSDWQGVSGDYADDTGEPSVEGLLVSGLYGDIKRPERVREALLIGAADRSGSARARGPVTFRFTAEELAEWEVKGAPVTVSCQVVVRNADNERSRTVVPMCAWADSSTAAVRSSVTATYSTGEPADVDLEQEARSTLALRAELRRST